MANTSRRSDKPKWMRWRTYETKLKVWEEAVEKANTDSKGHEGLGLWWPIATPPKAEMDALANLRPEI